MWKYAKYTGGDCPAEDDCDGFYSDEDLPVILNDKLARKEAEPSKGFERTTEDAKETANTSNNGYDARLLRKKVSVKFRHVPFPQRAPKTTDSHDGSCGPGTRFACQLLGCFQGGLFIRFSDFPTIFHQIHREPLDFKRYIKYTKNMLEDPSQQRGYFLDTPSSEPHTDRWASVKKFGQFVQMVPWLPLYSFAHEPQMIWVLRVDVGVPPWIEKVSGCTLEDFITKLVCGLFGRETRVKRSTLECLLSTAIEMIDFDDKNGCQECIRKDDLVDHLPLILRDVLMNGGGSTGSGFSRWTSYDDCIVVFPLPPVHRISCKCSMCLAVEKRIPDDSSHETVPKKAKPDARHPDAGSLDGKIGCDARSSKRIISGGIDDAGKDPFAPDEKKRFFSGKRSAANEKYGISLAVESFERDFFLSSIWSGKGNDVNGNFESPWSNLSSYVIGNSRDSGTDNDSDTDGIASFDNLFAPYKLLYFVPKDYLNL